MARIDYDAPASLHKWTALDRRRAGNRAVGCSEMFAGTLVECVTQFLTKAESLKPLYDIMVSEQAGLGDAILDYKDIEAIAGRSDFPKPSHQPAASHPVASPSSPSGIASERFEEMVERLSRST